MHMQELSIKELITKTLYAEAAKIIEEESVAMAKTVERRMKEKTAIIAVKCLERFSFERCGNELVIRVEFDSLKKKES